MMLDYMIIEFSQSMDYDGISVLAKGYLSRRRNYVA